MVGVSAIISENYKPGAPARDPYKPKTSVKLSEILVEPTEKLDSIKSSKTKRRVLAEFDLTNLSNNNTLLVNYDEKKGTTRMLMFDDDDITLSDKGGGKEYNNSLNGTQLVSTGVSATGNATNNNVCLVSSSSSAPSSPIIDNIDKYASSPTKYTSLVMITQDVNERNYSNDSVPPVPSLLSQVSVITSETTKLISEKLSESVVVRHTNWLENEKNLLASEGTNNSCVMVDELTNNNNSVAVGSSASNSPTNCGETIEPNSLTGNVILAVSFNAVYYKFCNKTKKYYFLFVKSIFFFCLF